MIVGFCILYNTHSKKKMNVCQCLQNVSQLCFFNSAGSQLTCCDTGPWSSEDLFVSGFRPTQEVFTYSIWKRHHFR